MGTAASVPLPVQVYKANKRAARVRQQMYLMSGNELKLKTKLSEASSFFTSD